MGIKTGSNIVMQQMQIKEEPTKKVAVGLLSTIKKSGPPRNSVSNRLAMDSDK